MLALNGILSFIGTLLVFFRHRYAGIGTMILGVLMFIWICAQVYWIGWESWLQQTFLIVGLIEIALGFVLDVKHSKNQGMFRGHGHYDSPAH